ncbi:hypothetical protein BJ912DRAFT_982375 [Pholiota molesta]|nr:hypothetical protein BJ912DRAFT_982375 [Pholiota molesta]
MDFCSTRVLLCYFFWQLLLAPLWCELSRGVMFLGTFYVVLCLILCSAPPRDAASRRHCFFLRLPMLPPPTNNLAATAS